MRHRAGRPAGLALAAIVATGAAGAVESAPLAVLRVVDGDTIHVAGMVPPELAVPVAVRLRWIEAPEVTDNPHGEGRPAGRAAAGALADLLPVGSRVVLWHPDADFPADRGARVLAVVYPLAGDRRSGVSLQETLVAAGWAIYWQEYGPAPAGLDGALAAAMAAARTAGLGVWRDDPDWAATTAAAR
jgi:endonuclease YncB( thermonuclease family)